jgi:hypothetical protein
MRDAVPRRPPEVPMRIAGQLAHSAMDRLDERESEFDRLRAEIARLIGRRD